MVAGVVTGYFSDKEHVHNATEALKTRSLNLKSISSEDEGGLCENYNNETAPSASAYRFLTVGTIIGVIVGAIAGFSAIRLEPGFAYFLAIGPLMAIIGGGACGGLVGVLLAGLLHFDATPDNTGKRVEDSGNLCVSVQAKDKHELDVAEAIMEERGATELHTKLEPSASPVSETLTKELAKIT